MPYFFNFKFGITGKRGFHPDQNLNYELCNVVLQIHNVILLLYKLLKISN